jgi:predicted exporter
VMPQGARQLAALQAAADLPGVTFVDKAGSVSALFRGYRQSGGVWLFGALVLVYGVLCLRYGARTGAAMLVPTLLAMALALACFGYLGAPLTLFNLMGLMLVLGVGVNYSIFLREGGERAPTTLAGVLLSAATTLLSFGLLAFSSMPALASFGLTLLIGIGIAVLLAPMVLSFEREATA